MEKGIAGLYLASCLYCYSASAQTQSTLGACSPALANLKGNVNITCILPNRRIKIAKYVGSFDGDNLDRFREFLYNNDGKVVYIDGSVANYSVEWENMRGSQNTVAVKNERIVNNERIGGGQFFSVSGSSASEALYYASGAFVLRGYFIPNNIMGVHQGWSDTELKRVDTEKITLSDKFETD